MMYFSTNKNNQNKLRNINSDGSMNLSSDPAIYINHGIQSMNQLNQFADPAQTSSSAVGIDFR